MRPGSPEDLTRGTRNEDSTQSKSSESSSIGISSELSIEAHHFLLLVIDKKIYIRKIDK
ncbi:13250_t:CDS:2 [Ambispora leptoticha]|uniref:13250_t:CDS:1 n=1 Tax=Ambispora leptoticha TaxID=144679 RepID=A0A9N9D3A9_9GLOM|nr:13250_t:CDS:2 [Ambispora leptoticha]